MGYYTDKDFPTIDWRSLQGYNPYKLPDWRTRNVDLGLVADDGDDDTSTPDDKGPNEESQVTRDREAEEGAWWDPHTGQYVSRDGNLVMDPVTGKFIRRGFVGDPRRTPTNLKQALIDAAKKRYLSPDPEFAKPDPDAFKRLMDELDNLAWYQQPTTDMVRRAGLVLTPTNLPEHSISARDIGQKGWLGAGARGATGSMKSFGKTLEDFYKKGNFPETIPMTVYNYKTKSWETTQQRVGKRPGDTTTTKVEPTKKTTTTPSHKRSQAPPYFFSNMPPTSWQAGDYADEVPDWERRVPNTVASDLADYSLRGLIAQGADLDDVADSLTKYGTEDAVLEAMRTLGISQTPPTYASGVGSYVNLGARNTEEQAIAVTRKRAFDMVETALQREEDEMVNDFDWVGDGPVDTGAEEGLLGDQPTDDPEEGGYTQTSVGPF